MKMTENDIIAAYVRSRYPNLIKTTDYNTYAACKRVASIFKRINDLFKTEYAPGGLIITEREQKYGRDEEGTSDGSAEASEDVRTEEELCGEPVSGAELGSNLQED